MTDIIQPRFLETITTLDNDVLVPIDRIKYITYGYYESGYEIKIISDDGNWAECFNEDNKKADFRYKMIKEIIGAK